MSQRLNDYLAREAADYLDQLRDLLSPQSDPDPERLLRLARGVRGSAQMAGSEVVASVAERIEDVARSVLTGAVVWSEAIRTLAERTVDDLQVLLRALNRWGPEEEARVQAAIERWNQLDARQPSLQVVAAEGPSAVPIEALFFDDAGPHVLSGPGAEEPVPIETLLLRGAPALRQALALRPQVERALDRGDAELGDLLHELFDLVELGLSEPGTAA